MNTLQLLKYPSNRKNETFWSALIVIVLIAAFFRFSGLHWDEGFSYTPHFIDMRIGHIYKMDILYSGS